ncbi:hypothetical protein DL764_009301 [Monosporascus ibericus]|uniref:Uncharacterized protein n=1 Tax=Monosporascus ibericus TaxID=155417 RepID=A0A4Q4SVB6_9PEZI|nr:hypothetical protein DL764_009301 [Monosporascus ibericus]
MDDSMQLKLAAFDLSSKDLDLSLSVASLAFIASLPAFQGEPTDVYRLVQSGDLWLLSPGFVQFEVATKVNGKPMSSVGPGTGFLEDVAEAICQCSIWQKLGLVICLDDIQYDLPYEGAPNLYLSIQHPDKSFALLSPPHALTAQFKGLESTFHFMTSQDEGRRSDPQTEEKNVQGNITKTRDLRVFSQATPVSATDNDVQDRSDVITFWHTDEAGARNLEEHKRGEFVAHLVDLALYKLLGVPKRHYGLQFRKLADAPSLLQLAPAIWNSHYLRAAAAHAKKFPVISEVLATSIQAQSSSLRNKAAKLLEHDRLPPQGRGSAQGSSGSNWNDQKLLRHHLWRLLQTTLKPGIFTHKRPKDFPSPAGNVDDVGHQLPTCLDEPEDSNAFNDFGDVVPELHVEGTLDSDWALPQLSAYDYQEYDSGVYPADGQLWREDDNTGGCAPIDATQQEIDVEWQEMDTKSLLRNEPTTLPSYHSYEQYRRRGPWDDFYQRALTSETMDEEHVLNERSAPIEEIVDWVGEADGFERQEFVGADLVTSETMNIDAEDDNAHHLPNLHSYGTETGLENDSWEYIE